jgi:hypothetical protein
MRTKSIVAVSLVVLTMAPLAQAWSTPPNPAAATRPAPSVAYPAAQPYSAPGQAYGGSYQAPSVHQRAPGAPDYSSGTQDDPNYPYGPYHNPYYDGAAYPRNFLSGTVDWLFSLPAYAIDSFTGFLDNSVFPRVPATSGGSTQAQPQGAYPPQGTPATSAPLPPANPVTGLPGR